MGHVFDIHSARLYEKWYGSSRGVVLEGFIETFFRKIVSPAKNERVLDIGCGSGNHLLLLNSLGLNIYGTDASPYMLDLARKRLGNRCEFKKGRAEDLPYDDDDFEYAVLINTLELLDDPVEALREAGRVARKKVIVIAVNSLSLMRIRETFGGLFYESFSNILRGYNLNRLKYFSKEAYGDVPVEWRSTLMPGLYRWNKTTSGRGYRVMSRCPFAYYLGLSVSMRYILKTDNLLLKRKPARVEHGVVGSVSPVSNMKNQFYGGEK